MSTDAQDRSERGVGAYGPTSGMLPLPPPSADVSAAGEIANDEDHIPLQIFVPELVLQVRSLEGNVDEVDEVPISFLEEHSNNSERKLRNHKLTCENSRRNQKYM